MAERETLHTLRVEMTPGDQKAEERLVQAAETLIRSAVFLTLSGSSGVASKEDALQEGRIATIKAIRGWREGYGASFSTYLFKAIQRAVWRWLLTQPMIRVPPSGLKAGYLPPFVDSLDDWRSHPSVEPESYTHWRLQSQGDFIADPDDHVAALLHRLRIEEILRKGLSERSYQVFQRLMEGYTAPEVGREFGLTPAQVYVIRATARKLIRSDDECDD